jgi:hypothetical protein
MSAEKTTSYMLRSLPQMAGLFRLICGSLFISLPILGIRPVQTLQLSVLTTKERSFQLREITSFAYPMEVRPSARLFLRLFRLEITHDAGHGA